jgi:hypothetical protein
MFGLGTKLRRKSNDKRSKNQAKMTILTSITESGTVMAVPVDTVTAARYLELHDIIPDSLPTWPETDLDELVDELVDGDFDSCERVLILLAHHKSSHAAALLQELMEILPVELDSFAELAYAEAIGWLGYNYVRQSEGPPSIEPSSMMAAS